MSEENLPAEHPPEGEFLLYQTEDGQTRIECRFAGESIWLSQLLMADLFQVTVPTINEHLKNLFEEREIRPNATIRKFRIVRQEGSRQVTRQIDHYNLDAILAVGYRVRSHRGTQFRIWATERLRDYLVNGFTMDDPRLKAAGGGQYFEELLARIRDIRSSERVFWRKVLDIYATSIDYDPAVEASQLFFKTVQKKCTGLPTATLPLRLSISAPTHRGPAWASHHGAARSLARRMSPSPKTTSAQKKSKPSIAS